MSLIERANEILQAKEGRTIESEQVKALAQAVEEALYNLGIDMINSYNSMLRRTND